MSFGYAIGDVLAVAQLAWRTVQNTRKACGEHDELTHEVMSLHAVLCRVEHDASKPNSIFHRATDDTREELRTAVGGCGRVLGTLDKIVVKYNALSEEEKVGRKLWSKIRFGNSEMINLGELKLKILTYTSAVTLLLNLISMGSQGRVEQQMDNQGSELREIRQSLNWISASLSTGHEGSILTTYAGDDKAVWKELRRELLGEGHSSNLISKHKALIIDYVKELGDRGALDDTFILDDSTLASRLDNNLTLTPPTVYSRPSVDESPLDDTGESSTHEKPFDDDCVDRQHLIKDGSVAEEPVNELKGDSVDHEAGEHLNFDVPEQKYDERDNTYWEVGHSGGWRRSPLKQRKAEVYNGGEEAATGEQLPDPSLSGSKPSSPVPACPSSTHPVHFSDRTAPPAPDKLTSLKSKENRPRKKNTKKENIDKASKDKVPLSGKPRKIKKPPEPEKASEQSEPVRKEEEAADREAGMEGSGEEESVIICNSYRSHTYSSSSYYYVLPTLSGPCKHQWCRVCLWSAFTMSLSSPQDMPPKCCGLPFAFTTIRHLVGAEFKTLWKQKFEEYTADRIGVYCPQLACGQYIGRAPNEFESGYILSVCPSCNNTVCIWCNQNFQEGYEFHSGCWSITTEEARAATAALCKAMGAERAEAEISDMQRRYTWRINNQSS